jgi:hypothetical protein
MAARRRQVSWRAWRLRWALGSRRVVAFGAV